MSDQYPHRLAQFVATEIRRRNWSDREAGRRLRLNHVTLENVINGATQYPEDGTLDKLTALRDGTDRATLRRWSQESPVSDGANVATSTSAGILTPMGVIDCVRAYLDQLAAQIAAGTLTDAEARRMLDRASRQTNGSRL